MARRRFRALVETAKSPEK